MVISNGLIIQWGWLNNREHDISEAIITLPISHTPRLSDDFVYSIQLTVNAVNPSQDLVSGTLISENSFKISTPNKNWVWWFTIGY